MRGALFSLNLVSLTPKISNVKLCSEIRVVGFQCEKKVKRYSNERWKLTGLVVFAGNCFRRRVVHSFIELINEILARWGVVFYKDSKLNFGSLVCFKEFLIGDSPKSNNIFKAVHAIPRRRAFLQNFIGFRFILLHFMCTQIWHLSHCTAWWLLATVLLQILHGNLITIVNCWKSRLAVYSMVEKE